MTNPNPVQSDAFKAQQNTAPDTAGGTVTVPAKISPQDKEWLKSLPGGVSYNIRQAIQAYKKSFENA
jgi:hypothetical protein